MSFLNIHCRVIIWNSDSCYLKLTSFNKMAEKRKRSQNYTSDEKDKLVKLLSLHKDTILNKRTDGSTNEAKNKAWIEATNAFNSSATTYRTKDSLIKVWEKLKSDSKLYHNATKRSSSATGGGPSEVKYDPVLEQVCALLGRACTGILDVPDCDMETESDKENTLSKKMNDVSIEYILQQNNEDNQSKISHTTQSVVPEETINISKTPLWSRRRPQVCQTNERTEAMSLMCSSFNNVNKKKEDTEDLKRKLLEEELTFKRDLYKLQLQTAATEVKIKETQLQAAAKEVEIKETVLRQLKDGVLNWKNLFGSPQNNQ